MKKIKFIVLGLISCVLMAGCSVTIENTTTKEVSGKAKTVTSEAESDEYKEYFLDMEELRLRTKNVAVTIEPSDKAYIEVTYSEGLDDYGFYATIKNGEIKIGTTSSKRFKDKNFHAVIHANIANCEFAGSYEVEWNCAPVDNMNINMSGAMKCNINKMDCKNLDIKTSGASELTINGKAENADFQMSGASEYRAKELVCKNVEAQLNGASEMEISVSDLLDVEVHGAGEVNYYGSPKVEQEVHGAGRVKQKSKEVFF